MPSSTLPTFASSHIHYGQRSRIHPFRKIFLLLFCLFAASRVYGQACPDLGPFLENPDNPADWALRDQQLSVLMPRCLQSSEYFALLGAAKLNSGSVREAAEVLERALLLNPENGGAQIDYAQALYSLGQLFPALELNRQIVARDDLPAGLRPSLEQRQQRWRSRTRQHSVQADVLVGYDDNLNSAPSPSQITLTQGGESVLLILNPDDRPVSGPYTNLRLVSRHRQLTPNAQHNAMFELRGRVSEDSDSNLAQFNGRYAFIKPDAQKSWQLSGGVSHLRYGDRPLYSSSEIGARYTPVTNSSCQHYLVGAAQHQVFHGQSALNAVETRLGAGLNCGVRNPWLKLGGRQQINSEISMLMDRPIKQRRAGDERKGWQIDSTWQVELSRAVLSTQFNYTEIHDTEGYHVLLENNARRWTRRAFVLVQYRRPVFQWLPDTVFMVNLYHQRQNSNLELFRSQNNSVELGFSHDF